MKTEKKRSFRGAVLLTVVSVMSLLIVFLTSTLVLATAANNRAHKSYSSSQASYTARAVIDSILAAAKKDENFAIAMNSLKDSGSFDVNVDITTSAAGIGKVDKATISYAGKKQFYDNSKQEWVERDLISITADVTSGGETKTITAYVLKDPPQPGGGGGGGGGFVTVGSATISNHTNSFGGTYLGIGMDKGTRYYKGDYNLLLNPDVKLEDKFYLNRKDGAVADIDASGAYIPNVPENSDILVKFETGNDQTIEAPFVVNGSLDVNTQTHVYFPTKGSGMSVWGNMDIQNSSFKVFSETVNNDTAVKYNQEITKFNEIPYIYVDSLLKLKNQTIGDDKLPLNIFCGSIDAQQNNVSLYADIYCQDSGKISHFGSDSASVLYSWSNSVVNGTDTYLSSCTSGNLYTKGNAEIKMFTVNGNVKAEGWLKIANSTINGDVICGDNINLTNTTIKGDLYYKGSLTKDDASTVEGTIYSFNGYSLNSQYDYYENELHENELLPRYEVRENIFHSGIFRSGYKEYDNVWARDYVDVDTSEISWSNEVGGPVDKFGNPVTDWDKLYYINGVSYKFEPKLKVNSDGGIDFDENGNLLSPIIEPKDENAKVYYDPYGNECSKDEATSDHYTEWNNEFQETSEQYYYYYVEDDGSLTRCGQAEAKPNYYYVRENGEIIRSTDHNPYAGVTFYNKSDPTKTPVTDPSVLFVSASEEDEINKVFNEIYPRKAERAVILGFEEIGDGTPIADSKVLKTVEEIEEDYNFSAKSITEIDSNYLEAVNQNVYTKSNVPDEILNQSCTLSGSGFNKTIYIKNTSTNDIWVRLKDFEMDKKDFEDYGIIYDDSAPNCGNLILFVEGNVKFDGGSIMTKSYYDLIKNKETFQIANDDDLYAKDDANKVIGEKAASPKIKIYSEKAKAYDAKGNVSTPSLKFWNFDGPNKVVTAAIEAPNMAFYIQKAAPIQSEVYYDGIKVRDKEGNAKCVGVIGVLNVAYADGQNDWTFLYTHKGLPDKDDDEGTKTSKEFDIMYYDGF
ncbi:MAG: hypothetical protein K2J40_03340 [Ruminococcus sp.]|nr:hypothetical protein [Ruminococcus sp.]